MISLHITDVKEFMQLLLATDTFDTYLLEEATVVREYTFSLDGTLTQDYYSESELEEQELKGLRFLPYGRLRQTIFDQIKGKRTPELLKLILALPKEEAVKRMPDFAVNDNSEVVSEFLMQIIYDANGLILRSGVSYRTFVPDKSMEHEWEGFLLTALKKHEICAEIL